MTILLDVPVDVGLTRKGNKKPDRFEKEDVAFHRRVRDGYLEIASVDPQRWLVIDARQPEEKIARTIWQKVSRLLASQGVD